MRSYIEKRNALILALSKFVGCPVLMASQVEPEMEPPFIVYSITSDYTPDNGLGNYSLEDGSTEGTAVEVREEQPTTTMSFTACSINRIEEKDGERVSILGADEALELATLAQGFFLHGGRYATQKAGFVVVDVTNATSRDALELDEMGRRFGFDVRLRYTRTDLANVDTVSNVTTKQKE